MLAVKGFNLPENLSAKTGVAKKGVSFLKQKKAGKLSQYPGPTSTYEKHPLRRVLTLIQSLCRNSKRLNSNEKRPFYKCRIIKLWKLLHVLWCVFPQTDNLHYKKHNCSQLVVIR